MKYAKAIASLLFTLGLVYALNTRLGPAPPVGKFLNPFGGFWANAEPRNAPAERKLTLPGLRGEVTILFDDNRVPHIFAANNHDLYYVQGYITATDRLWQMELQTHAAAGRVSEIIGERAVELDRYTRRRGMVPAAKASLQAMLADPQSKEVLEAYAAGVNAYISGLSPKDYPLEYKVLDYAPEPWEPLKSALLLKQMATTLSTSDDEGEMTNVLEKYGQAAIKELFPDYPFREDPIIPPGTKWDFQPVPSPKTPEASPQPPPKEGAFKTPLPFGEGPGLPPSGVSISPKGQTSLASGFQPPKPEFKGDIGSNNWAVSGAKSATGYPILANDPHLDLTLPSIWYQIQLTGPDVNVCGATLPGAPHVISGFNERVAWGVTNVGSDVMDWYKISYKDAGRQQYWHGGQWKPVRKVVEVIKIRGKPDVIDTVSYTHHGPVVYDQGMKPMDAGIPVGCALRWAAHEPSNETRAFYQLNRAKNYPDYVAALQHYKCPAQNFVFASVENDVAIWPNGKFPLKWKGQGKFILDGSNAAHDWQGWIPHAHNPHVLNPPRGFVSSANQFSADTTYPYYLNWEFAYSSRGRRINERLTAMQRATPDSLRMLQNDNFSVQARDVLPSMLSYVSQNQLSGEQMQVYQAITNWDKQNNPDAIGATVFTLWWQYFSNKLWDEFDASQPKPLRIPSRDRTVQLLLTEPQSQWIDHRKTRQKETLADLVTQSFRATADTLAAKRGTLGENWRWAAYKSTRINHLSRGIPAFSRYDLPIGGGSGIVNATTGANGPSWRMVVALGPTPRAYGLYPGGQSGNPGSFYYDNMVDIWAKGELPELVFLRRPDDKNAKIMSRWTMGK